MGVTPAHFSSGDHVNFSLAPSHDRRSRVDRFTDTPLPIDVQVFGEDLTWLLTSVHVPVPGEDHTWSLTPVGVLVPCEGRTWSISPVRLLVRGVDRTWSLMPIGVPMYFGFFF